MNVQTRQNDGSIDSDLCLLTVEEAAQCIGEPTIEILRSIDLGFLPAIEENFGLAVRLSDIIDLRRKKEPPLSKPDPGVQREIKKWFPGCRTLCKRERSLLGELKLTPESSEFQVIRKFYRASKSDSHLTLDDLLKSRRKSPLELFQFWELELEKADYWLWAQNKRAFNTWEIYNTEFGKPGLTSESRKELLEDTELCYSHLQTNLARLDQLGHSYKSEFDLELP